VKPTTIDRILARCDSWEESKHPRDEKGQFGAGVGVGGVTNARRELDAALMNTRLPPPHSNIVVSELKTAKGNAQVEFKSGGPNTIEIDQIRANERGSGRAAMEYITEIADKHGVDLSLYAVPTRGPEGFKLSVIQLVRFYESFGFKQVGKSKVRDVDFPIMRRESRTSKLPR